MNIAPERNAAGPQPNSTSKADAALFAKRTQFCPLNGPAMNRPRSVGFFFHEVNILPSVRLQRTQHVRELCAGYLHDKLRKVISRRRKGDLLLGAELAEMTFNLTDMGCSAFS
jgi:hypothetical protein